jgi:protein-S-isoprenylcysteine O-methyltransferase Ste14
MSERPTSGRRAWNLTKTIVQLVCFWFVFLFALPIGISIVEIELGIQRFPPQMILAAIALPLFTLLSVWAAVTLSLAGDGTPLPLDRARRLVVRGPYAFVRNPLIIATLGQAAAVAVALGSLPVSAYVLIGAVAWYFFIRPAEERELAERFGQDWKRYAAEVRVWRPRVRPYQSKPT